MAMWVCPHCGAPQTETARCWVCRRSSTTCSTCRHFRTSLAADVGFCAKDRWRTPLTGLELRACWEEGHRPASDAASASTGGSGPGAEPARRPGADAPPRRTWTIVRGDGGPLDRPDPMRLRGFVPIDEVAPPATGSLGQGAPITPAVVAPSVAGPSRPARSKRARPSKPASRRSDRTLPVDDWETRVSLFGEADL